MRLSYYFLIAVLVFSTATMAKGQKPKIFVQCSVSQGNGFNWASTIGWLSEMTRQMGVKAKSYQDKNPGQMAFIDLRCHTGASSSSFTAALFEQLLDNEQLLGKTKKIDGRFVLTAAQAARLADALHFMSLSTDFTAAEALNLLGQGATSIIPFPSFGDKQNALKLNLWGNKANANFVMQTFATWISAASFIPFNKDQLSLIKIPKFSSRARLASLKTVHRNKESAVIKKNMFSARKIVNKYTNKKKKSVVLKKKLSDHMCAGVFLIPASKETKAPFSYKKLTIAFLCNDKTYQKLVKSESLRKALNSSDITKNKIMLATTKNWNTALNISMREPGLLSEVSGKLNAPHMGIQKASRFQKGRFVSIKTNQNYLVIGGFPEQRMQAWSTQALLTDQVRRYKKLGYQAEGRLAIFGKVDIRDRIASFAEATIAKYFGGEERVSEYHAWQDDFCFSHRRSQDIKNTDFYSMDWNLTSLPAALSDTSFILTSKGINLGRLQTDLNKHSDLHATNILFDPLDEDKFLPVTTTACPTLH